MKKIFLILSLFPSVLLANEAVMQNGNQSIYGVKSFTNHNLFVNSSAIYSNEAVSLAQLYALSNLLSIVVGTNSFFAGGNAGLSVSNNAGKYYYYLNTNGWNFGGVSQNSFATNSLYATNAGSAVIWTGSGTFSGVVAAAWRSDIGSLGSNLFDVVGAAAAVTNGLANTNGNYLGMGVGWATNSSSLGGLSAANYAQAQQLNGYATTGTTITVTGNNVTGTVNLLNGGTINLGASGGGTIQTQTNGVNAVNSGTLNFIASTGLTRSITNNAGKADLIMSVDGSVVVTNGATGVTANGGLVLAQDKISKQAKSDTNLFANGIGSWYAPNTNGQTLAYDNGVVTIFCSTANVNQVQLYYTNMIAAGLPTNAAVHASVRVLRMMTNNKANNVQAFLFGNVENTNSWHRLINTIYQQAGNNPQLRSMYAASQAGGISGNNQLGTTMNPVTPNTPIWMYGFGQLGSLHLSHDWDGGQNTRSFYSFVLPGATTTNWQQYASVTNALSTGWPQWICWGALSAGGATQNPQIDIDNLCVGTGLIQ